MGILNLLGLGEEEPPPSINAVLQQITRRAERLDPKQQAQTFVSLGGIEKALSHLRLAIGSDDASLTICSSPLPA